MDILAALDDPRLFQPLFSDGSWATWRVFLASLFGLPLTADERAIYTTHTGRAEPPLQPFRECALVIGRRGGKSRVLGLIAVFLASFRDYSAHVVPGETPTVAVIAADRKQARVLLNYIVGTFQAVPLLAPLIAEKFAESVMLTSGVSIEIHTGSIGSPRGRTFIAVLCDEIAFWRSEDSVNPDADVVAAVRPGLATIPNSVLVMASSPYAQRGVLYNTFRRHYGKDESRTLVWRGTSLEMNPALDPGVVEAAMEEDPDSARAEFFAEFRSDVAAFVTREVVAACVVPGRFELPPIAGTHYVAFVDPSGGSSDSMTLAISHHDRKLGVTVLDCAREVRPPFSPQDVVNDFCALLKSYRITKVVGDRYAGEWPRERFRENGVTYEPSEKVKSDLYRDVLPMLNSGKCELLDLSKLANQLCGLERRTARGGRDSIDHAPGSHDDLANSVAGALLLAGAVKPVMKITPELMEKINAMTPSPGTPGWWARQ